MSQNPNDVPAFPAVERMADRGLSLWDYFAAAALAGALANPEIKKESDTAKCGDPDSVPGGYAKIAAEMADAMMIERAQRLAE